MTDTWSVAPLDVNPAELSAAGEKLAGSGDGLVAALSALTGARFTSAADTAAEHVDAFVADMPWEGATEQAHKEWHQLWRSGVDDLREGLRTIRDGAKIAHSNYRNAVNTNLNMWD